MNKTEYELRIIRSGRKSLSIEITRDCSVVVRAPNRLPRTEIEKFLAEREGWIEEHLSMMRKRREEENEASPFTPAELDEMSKAALGKVLPRAAHYSSLLGVEYKKITVRRQVSRWGSCSSRKNLSFNCLLALVPDDVLDYIVVHELCHLREMNHSASFWREVGRVIPDYREKRLWLRDNGGKLIQRLRISVQK